MERLTSKLKGQWLCDHKGFCTAASCENCIVAKQIERLAEYEDTGLTPEQISEYKRQIEAGELVRRVQFSGSSDSDTSNAFCVEAYCSLGERREEK